MHFSSGSERANNYHQVQSFRRKLNTNWNFSSNVGIIFWELYERTKGFLGGKVNGQFCWNDGKPPNNEICLHNGWNFHRKSGILRKAIVFHNNPGQLWFFGTKWFSGPRMRRVEQYCAFYKNDSSLCDAAHVNIEAKYHQVPFPLLLNVTKHFVNRSIGQWGFATAFQTLPFS